MGPVRMISSGHELTTDYDEKTLHELGFKDMQVWSLITASFILISKVGEMMCKPNHLLTVKLE